MMFVRLRNDLVELPTALTLSEQDDLVCATDARGLVIARFERLCVLAWSKERDKVSGGLEPVSAGEFLENNAR